MKIWRPYTQMASDPVPLQLDSAEGAYLYTKDGRKIFDGISSWWLISHGHSHPQIVEAVSRQAARLEQAVFANFTHEPAESLSAMLGKILPKQLCHLFFSDNGSTAVEVAMKMAYQYRLQTGSSKKNKFVAFEKSYHGDTCGAMSVSGEGPLTRPYRGLRFDVIRANQGCSVRDPIEKWTEHFRQILESRSSEIGAVLIEPLVQGAGGMIIWPIEAIREICKIARVHDTLVIFDEVMTGFGRTGTLFALEQIGETPDFLCLSKGLTGGFLPMGLTVTTERVFRGFLDSRSDKMFFHGHSFTGNPLSCAAAVASLELFESTSVLSNAAIMKEAHLASLKKLKNFLPVRELRVCGTIGIMELESDMNYGGEFSAEIMRSAMNRGLFIRPLGSTIYLMPPYCSTAQEIEWAWSTIGETLQSLGM